jgi:hypothetical protein
MARLLRASTTAAAFVACLSGFTSPGFAQLANAPSPTFNHGIVVGGEWLQANALPLNRDALGSLSFDAALRRSRWAVDAGWLRIARDLSTVQGGFVSVGLPLAWGRLLAIPSIGGFGGQAQRSVDSTGFDWIGSNNTTGHTPRFSYSESGSVGGGVGLTLEVPVVSVIAIRASASEWYFSGATLEGDRARSLIGVGLSIRLHQLGGTR